MDKDEVAQALNIVAKLNEELDKQDFVEACFSLSTDMRWSTKINFWADGLGDVVIWDSGDDEREWSDEKEDLEDLEGFLRRKAKAALRDAAKQAGYVKL